VDRPVLPVTVKLAARSNYGARQNTHVDLVVLHTTESCRTPAAIEGGRSPSAVNWFADPSAKASAHYVIGREGAIWGSVPEGEAAWHCGNALWNRRSIGIEVEGFAGKRETWSPEVMAALVALVADICQRHGIPADPAHIIGHADVPDPASPWLKGGRSHHTDPGPHLQFGALVDAVRAELAEGVA
jgi:N-acetyl-anhydromuramyl-L-alanine amidase AmpD